MLLTFILIKFCKIFCFLRLYITLGYWAIDQLVLFPLVRYVASLARAKLDQGIDKFCFIKMTIEHFICLYWKPTWFEKLHLLSIAIGMVDPQVAFTKRLEAFCCWWCSLICKNGLSVQCLQDVYYSKSWLALIRLLESVWIVATISFIIFWDFLMF